MDDEDRENEGDVICAAEHATLENVNFMATYARGLICMPMSQEYTDKLHLPQMCSENTDNHCTAFTVSIDHKDTTTGISAEERALTARMVVDDQVQPWDFRRPGHMFPLLAKKAGCSSVTVIRRQLWIFVCLAGLKPVGLCCEIMKEDGTMARKPDLLQFAEDHNLKCGRIADLVQYRKEHEVLVECVARQKCRQDTVSLRSTVMSIN